MRRPPYQSLQYQLQPLEEGRGYSELAAVSSTVGSAFIVKGEGDILDKGISKVTRLQTLIWPDGTPREYPEPRVRYAVSFF